MLEHDNPESAELRLLACAVFEPALRSLLIVGASLSRLQEIAATLEAFTSAAFGDLASCWQQLSGYETEESLFGSYQPAPAHKFQAVAWTDGILIHEDLVKGSSPRWRWLLVPNLANTSLSLLRAIVATHDTPQIQVERDGQQLSRPNRLAWLAACPTDEIKRVSPHVRDRFAIQLLSGGKRSEKAAAAELAAALNAASSGASDGLPRALKAEWADRLRTAAVSQPPRVPDRVIDYAIGIVNDECSTRHLARLGRLACALARLDLATEVAEYHVEEAASALSLHRQKDDGLRSDNKNGSPEPPLPAPVEPGETRGIGPSRPTVPRDPNNGSTVLPPAPPPSLLGPPQALPSDPIPHNELTDVEPVDHLSLSFSGAPDGDWPAHGAVIGTQPVLGTTTNIAVVATLLEAAKYQPYRHQAPDASPGLSLYGRDLRCYRHARVPEQMLIVVADFTAMRHASNSQSEGWSQRLLSHLRWAYTKRAPFALVRVGHRDALNILRAEHTQARNLLAANGVELLEKSQGGSATPLAHGLALAQKILLEHRRHFRNGRVYARLVLLTDGRGNVPLEASLNGKIEGSAGRRGVDDALRTARSIGRIKHVRTVVIDPEGGSPAELPGQLAVALDAELDSAFFSHNR